MNRFLKIMGSIVIVFASIGLYAQDEQPMIGQPSPLFELKDVDGKTYSLEQLKGKYIVFHFSFPVLLDTNGAVSAKYAPEGVQPALARDEVPIASNLVIDKEGRIRFY